MIEKNQLEPIPEAWPQVVEMLQRWRLFDSISIEQWDQLTRWLLDYSPSGQGFLAGEIAAELIQERAPDLVIDRFLSGSASSSWGVHFQNIACVGHWHPRKQGLLELAKNDPNLVVRSFAQSLMPSNTPDEPMLDINAIHEELV